MEQKYTNWIKTNVIETYGKCVEVSQSMAEAFPELTRVRGWYDCPIWGEREHWWCVDLPGDVVDPTAAQFPSKGIGEYRQFEEGVDREAVGKCPNCGGYIYVDDDNYGGVCSRKCANAYTAYLMGDA